MNREEKKKADKDKQVQQRRSPLSKLCRRIDQSKVIPILSNDVLFNQIFDIDGDGVIGISNGQSSQERLNIEKQLSNRWAKTIDFPLNEGREQLARVALYNRVAECEDDWEAKTGYLIWLKSLLLELAQDDPSIPDDIIEEQDDDLERSRFSDLAAELGYPRFSTEQVNPLSSLAQLNLPIYVTTSYFNFLERAIEANGRTPRTQICLWSKETTNFVDDSHRPDHSFVPTSETPLVYHLFGLEDYPETLVLTEDDYIDFLTAISQDTDPIEPLLPLYLRQALTQSTLLLLGYQFGDWDFRILFRGIIGASPSGLRQKMQNLTIQIDPAEQEWQGEAEAVREYLKDYFEKKESQLRFTVEYGTTAAFVSKLWEAWDQWRR